DAAGEKFGVDRRKAMRKISDRASVEEDLLGIARLQVVDDFSRHHIKWGKLGQRVQVFQKAVALCIDKHCSFTANRFGDEHIAAACAGDVQHRRVELHEFDITSGGPGAQ